MNREKLIGRLSRVFCGQFDNEAMADILLELMPKPDPEYLPPKDRPVAHRCQQGGKVRPYPMSLCSCCPAMPKGNTDMTLREVVRELNEAMTYNDLLTKPEASEANRDERGRAVQIITDAAVDEVIDNSQRQTLIEIIMSKDNPRYDPHQRPSCFFQSDVARAVDEVLMLSEMYGYGTDNAGLLRAAAEQLKRIADEAEKGKPDAE